MSLGQGLDPVKLTRLLEEGLLHLRAWKAVLGLRVLQPSRSSCVGLSIWSLVRDALRLVWREWNLGQWSRKCSALSLPTLTTPLTPLGNPSNLPHWSPLWDVKALPSTTITVHYRDLGPLLVYSFHLITNRLASSSLLVNSDFWQLPHMIMVALSRAKACVFVCVNRDTSMIYKFLM